MPARKEYFQCSCSTCCEVDDAGVARCPGGKPQLVRFRQIHLRGHSLPQPASSTVSQVRRAAVLGLARQNAVSHPDVESLSAALFATTICDNGPDLDSQSSKLWISRNAHQSQLSSPDVSQCRPQVDDLTSAIGRICLSNTLSNQEVTASLPRKSAEAEAATAGDSRFNCNLHKKERNRRTLVAHEVLNKLESQMVHIERQSLSSSTFERLRPQLSSIRERLANVKRQVPSVKVRKEQLARSCERLEARLKPFGEAQPANDAVGYDSSHHFTQPIDRCDEISQISVFLGVISVVLFGVGRACGDFLLNAISLLLAVVFNTICPGSNAIRDRVLAQIPKSMKTALSRFNLEGHTTSYAVCPSCSCTHKPIVSSGSTSYPLRCTNRPHPEDDVCNTILVTDPGSCKTPIKTFVYHHFHDYLSGLLARPELEALMDKPCDDLARDAQKSIPAFAKDVWDAQFLRTFIGPCDQRLFVDRGPEGRFLFSLNVDFFNVEGNLQRNATTSCGIISCACLNLPIDLRYKPENMYLAGIIPGPHEPSGDQLNHFLDPLIDDLVDSWVRGIKISRTASYRDRVTRSAIACVVCDLPAARKTAQLASTSSHFYCSACQCSHLSTLGQSDFEEERWRFRDKDQLRLYAEAYRSATSSNERHRLFIKHGVRWSSLWRLPYWDPARQLVVDSMHCLLEGLAQSHFREYLGLTVATATKHQTESDMRPAFSQAFRLPDSLADVERLGKNDQQHIRSIHTLLTSAVDLTKNEHVECVQGHLDALHRKLMAKNMAALKFVATDLGLSPQAMKKVSKIHWVKALVQWRGTRPLTAPIRIYTSSPLVLKRIQQVIEETDTPSWLNSVPRNFGEARAGTLKADEWRTMATVYLPLALISLWGEGSVHPSQEIANHFRRTLDHTMQLVSAIRIACYRVMTESRMNAYRACIKAWLSDLKQVLPEASPRPNGHMACHIYDYIQLFGPVRSWWCFPFERLIGQLQRLPINHKFGELEETILQSFIQGSRLRCWLARPDCPPAIKECKTLFDKYIVSGGDESPFPTTVASNHGTNKQSQVVPRDLAALTSGSRVVLHARYSFNKSTYSRTSTHIGNSQVLFYAPELPSKAAVPGHIKYIFEVNGHVRLAVQRYLPAEPDDIDPFKQYPYFPARLYSSMLHPTLELVDPVNVLGHFARWQFTPKHVVVLSLTKE